MTLISNQSLSSLVSSIDQLSPKETSKVHSRTPSAQKTTLPPNFSQNQTSYLTLASFNQSANQSQSQGAVLAQLKRNITESSSVLDEIQHIQLVLCFVVITLGLMGNLTVIITFSKRWGRLRTYEVFLTSLAIADLLFSILSPTLIAFDNLAFIDLSFMGDFGCQFLNWLRVTALTVSAWTLIVISADRYMVLVWRPLIHQEPSKQAICFFIITMWAVASSLGMLYFFRVKMYSHPFRPTYFCGIVYKDPEEDWIHTSLLFVFQMAIPILTLTVLYSLMVRTLKSTELVHLNSRAKEIRYRRNRKAIRLFVTIVFVFYILVLPYQLFYIIYTAIVQKDKTLEQDKRLRIANSILILVYSLNGCLNPLIYARLHTSFRRTLCRFICCKWKTVKRRSRPTMKRKVPDSMLITGEDLPTRTTPVLEKRQNGIKVVESPLLMEKFAHVDNEVNGTAIIKAETPFQVIMRSNKGH